MMALCSPHTIVKHPCEFLTWALEYDNEANLPAEAGDKILPDSPLETSPAERTTGIRLARLPVLLGQTSQAKV